MNIDLLLRHATTLITTPRDVAKLRQMILTLAVQGKLVPQEAVDEPVEVLLRKMNIKPLSTATTYPIPLPYNWAWISPSQLGKISGGMTPSKAKTDYWSQGTINWYSSKDIKSDELYESELKISESAYQDTGLKLYPPGCLIFVTRSGILKHTFPVSINRTPATVNQDLKVLHPTISGMERYLQIMFKGLNNFIISDLVKTGMTVQSLMFDEFCTQPFPLPPLAEQRRIVARVDELMAICDTLEAQLQARAHMQARVVQAALARVQADPSPASIATLLDPKIGASPADLRQMILTLAVQGKLVPQEAGDEPAEVLLNSILLHKQNSKQSAQSQATQLPFAIPSNWICVPFGQIMINRDGERIPVSKEERDTRAKIYDYYGASGVIDKIDSYLFDKPLLLIGEDGANLINRSTPIAFIARGKYWVNNHAHVLDAYNEDLLRYIEIYINSIDLKPYVTGTAQPKMNQQKMNTIPVPLPPLAEQRRIVARVDELMALVDRLEAQQTQANTLGAQVLDALVGGV